MGRLAQLENSHSTTYYNKFVSKMLSGGLLYFFQKYSVLARLVGTTVDFWVTNSCEFIQRLETDWQEIQKAFQSDLELGQVVEVKTGLSDFHQQGKSVLALEFASGLKLIYKPKDLGLEVAFFKLVSWLNDRATLPQLKQMQVLNRSNYGWVEYIEHIPLEDSAAAVRYYQRAGMLLCLLYLFSGSDFHCENIIACGEYPVAIDLEMLMSAKIRQRESIDENTDALSTALEQFEHSVLGTSLLPRWEFGADGIAYDVSGFGGAGGQKTHHRQQVWQNINTDSMALGYEYAKTGFCSNIPLLDGSKLSPNDYQKELVDGFRSTYQLFMKHTEMLLAADSPIVGLTDCRVRALFRPSHIYSSLLQQTLQPKYLQSGVDRDIALDLLGKAFIDYKDKPNVWQVIEAEKQAMRDLDIPLFTARSSRDVLLVNESQIIDRYYQEPSYDWVTNRLRQLNERDLEQQISLIHCSLYASVANKAEGRSTKQPTPDLATISPLAAEKLVQQAVSIAQEMQKRAVRAKDGSVWWIGMEFVPDAGQLQPRSLGYDLYDGSAGVAFFMAALAKVTGNEEFRDLALSALQPTRNLCQSSSLSSKDKLIRQLGIGAGKGVGSIIYTLVRCSQFLDEPILLESARKFVSLLTPSNIKSDRTFDLVSGSAGLMLGLLTFYDATQDSQALELAKACGSHLIDNRVTSNTGLLTWATIGDKLLTGIAHGAAGIVYALLRLSAVVPDLALKQAASEAIAYERTMFSPQVQNWLDLRSDRQAFGKNWCNGAPGIGLARLGGLSALDTEVIRQDIKLALQTTQKIGIHNIDHLCCGNFGYAEVFLVAGSQLKRNELIEIAQKQAAYLVDRAEKTGCFQIFPGNFQSIYNPGFFQGTAGIGYQFLRLAYPELLPSVLLWQ